MRTKFSIAAIGILFVASGAAVEPLNADFEKLKERLVGAWSFVEKNKPYETIFESVSHGQALLERNSGFIAVYHPDGVHSLLMTLYTRDGNQPRFRAKGFGQNPASIRFVFQDITNWTKGTEHMTGLELFFKDRDHVIEKWKTRKPNGEKMSFQFELIRKNP